MAPIRDNIRRDFSRIECQRDVESGCRMSGMKISKGTRRST